MWKKSLCFNDEIILLIVWRSVIIKKFFKDIFNKGNFKDYFKRNKFFFLISFVFVLLSFYSGFNANSYAEIVKSLNPSILAFDEGLFLSLTIIVLGFTFSLGSLELVLLNSVSFGQIFLTGIININFVLRMIFALCILIFSLVGAFLVTKLEVRIISAVLSRKFDELISKVRVPLKDIILTIFFVLVFLMIYSIF